MRLLAPPEPELGIIHLQLHAIAHQAERPQGGKARARKGGVLRETSQGAVQQRILAERHRVVEQPPRDPLLEAAAEPAFERENPAVQGGKIHAEASGIEFRRQKPAGREKNHRLAPGGSASGRGQFRGDDQARLARITDQKCAEAGRMAREKEVGAIGLILSQLGTAVDRQHVRIAKGLPLQRDSRELVRQLGHVELLHADIDLMLHEAVNRRDQSQRRQQRQARHLAVDCEAFGWGARADGASLHAPGAQAKTRWRKKCRTTGQMPGRRLHARLGASGPACGIVQARPGPVAFQQ
jgi:hypothetical protein